MTAPATPRTDKFYDEVSDRESHDDGTNPNWSEPSKWSYEAILDLVDFARTFETELAAMTAERNYHNNERIRVKQLAEKAEAENAAQLAELTRIADALGTNEGHSSVVHIEALKAENAALLALVEEIKGRVQFGTSTHMGSDVVKLCDAALKEGK